MSEFATAVGQTFPWHELYTPDGAASQKFYADALGFGMKSMDMGEMGSYPMLEANGQGVAGIMQTAGTPGMENVPPHWAIYIAVDDVDARVTKCTELGATVMVPAMDVPTVGRMCLLQDPYGATFWIYKAATP